MAGRARTTDVWGKGVIEAIDYQTGKIRWSHEIGGRRVRRRADHRFRPDLHRRQALAMCLRSTPATARLSGTPARAANAEFADHL